MNITFLTAFIAGLVSFFAPCSLITLPTFLGYLGSQIGKQSLNNKQELRNKIFYRSLVYVFSFLVVFVILGWSSFIFSDFLFKNKLLFRTVGGLLIIFFGIFMLFGYKIRGLQILFYEKKISWRPETVGSGYVFALLVGATSAFAWTPCVGPILGSILVLASSLESSFQGALLLLTYGLGINLPFLIIAYFGTSRWLLAKISKKIFPIYYVFASLLILIGLSFTTGLSDYIFVEVNQIFTEFGFKGI